MNRNLGLFAGAVIIPVVNIGVAGQQNIRRSRTLPVFISKYQKILNGGRIQQTEIKLVVNVLYADRTDQ